MTHQQDNFAELVSLWLDDELSPADAPRLQAYLAESEENRQTFAAMQRVDAMLTSVSGRMVAPEPGFSRRVAARLVGVYPRRPWHTWAGIGALALGTVFIIIVLGTIVGMAVGAVAPSLLNVGLIYEVMAVFADTLASLGVYLNFLVLLVRTSLLTMSQPLFWGATALAACIAYLWFRLMQNIYQGQMSTRKLML